MKKFKTMLVMMMALVGMCVAFSSCSSDDDDDKVTPAAEYVAGSYVNTLEMTVMGETSTYENAEIKVEKVDDNTVNVVLPKAGEGMMALPSLTIPALKVTGSNGSYAFAVESYKGSIEVNGATKEYTVTLSGAFANGQLTLNYQLQYGKMPMPMIGKFVSTKK